MEETWMHADSARLGQLARTCDRLKVLVLPGVVVFPGTPTPFQPSDPGQRALVADALAGDRVLAVATPVSHDDSQERAPLHAVAVAGIIEFEQRLADGTQTIFFRALARVRLMAEHGGGKPYREFAVELLQDVRPPGGAAALAARRAALEACLYQLSNVLPSGSKARWLASNAPRIASPSVLADVVAAAVLSHPSRRRAVLEELDVAKRLDLVTGEIASFAHMLSQGPSPSA
jgi:uncharacterized protein